MRPPRFPVPLRHLWQEDDGFRKGRILNEAMARANGRLPHRDRRRHADSPGVRALAPALRAPRLVHPGKPDDARRNAQPRGPSRPAGAWRAPALADVRNRINGIHAPLLSRFSRGEPGPIYRTRGCNISYWRDDIVRVNGYNEDMEGWGREDTELVARLMNSGVRRRNLKFAAVAYHLHHRVASDGRGRGELRARARGGPRRRDVVRARHRSSSGRRVTAALWCAASPRSLVGGARLVARRQERAFARTHRFDAMASSSVPNRSSLTARAREPCSCCMDTTIRRSRCVHGRGPERTGLERARAAPARTRPAPAGLGGRWRDGVGARGANRARGVADDARRRRRRRAFDGRRARVHACGGATRAFAPSSASLRTCTRRFRWRCSHIGAGSPRSARSTSRAGARVGARSRRGGRDDRVSRVHSTARGGTREGRDARTEAASGRAATGAGRAVARGQPHSRASAARRVRDDRFERQDAALDDRERPRGDRRLWSRGDRAAGRRTGSIPGSPRPPGRARRGAEHPRLAGREHPERVGSSRLASHAARARRGGSSTGLVRQARRCPSASRPSRPDATGARRAAAAYAATASSGSMCTALMNQRGS